MSVEALFIQTPIRDIFHSCRESWVEIVQGAQNWTSRGFLYSVIKASTIHD